MLYGDDRLRISISLRPLISCCRRRLGLSGSAQPHAVRPTLCCSHRLRLSIDFNGRKRPERYCSLWHCDATRLRAIQNENKTSQSDSNKNQNKSGKKETFQKANMTNNNKERQINNRNYSKGSFLCVLLFDEQLEGKKKTFYYFMANSDKKLLWKKVKFHENHFKRPN